MQPANPLSKNKKGARQAKILFMLFHIRDGSTKVNCRCSYTKNFEIGYSRIERELQNSLWSENSMLAKPIRFFANRHNLEALGDLQKIRIGTASADLRPNGVLQLP